MSTDHEMFDWMDPGFTVVAIRTEDREKSDLAKELEREGVVIREFSPYRSIDIHHCAFPPGLILRLYGVEEVADRYLGYQIDKYLPNYFPVADDAGDQVLLQPRTGPARLCYTEYGALFEDELTDVGTDLYSFLANPVALSEFYDWRI